MNRFRLYSDCILVTGETHFLILDLTRERYFRFNNQWRKGVDRLLNADSQNVSDGELNALRDQMLRLELIFDSSSEAIPMVDLGTEFHIAGIVNTSLVEFTQNSILKLSAWLNKLYLIGVRHIQLICLETVSREIFGQLCSLLETSPARSCEIIVRYHPTHDSLDWAELFRKEIRIKSIILFAAPKKTLAAYGDNSMGVFVQTTQEIVDFRPHLISERNFTVNVRHYVEAINFNTAFHLKVAVDKLGYIKNSLEQVSGFGNIESEDIKDVVSDDAFQALWKINRDMVLPCNKCEFRYVCNYNGLLVQKNESWHLAKVCGYNPAEGIWLDSCKIETL